MRLFIVRHGHYTGDGSHDPPISALGMVQASDAGKAITLYSAHIYTIFSSPLRRAVMTAEVISGITGAPLSVVDALEPEADPWRFMDMVRMNTDHDIVLVGHLPNLRKICSVLCSPEEPGTLSIESGGMACLRSPPEVGMANFEVEHIFTSDQVRELALRSA